MNKIRTASVLVILAILVSLAGVKPVSGAILRQEELSSPCTLTVIESSQGSHWLPPARMINNLGSVVYYHGPLYGHREKDGTWTQVKKEEDEIDIVYVNDINDAGQVVGSFGIKVWRQNAFLWEDGVLTQLDHLDDPPQRGYRYQ